MILVTGATGYLGAAVLEQLLKRSSAEEITALARSEEKARPLRDRGIQVRLGNLDDPGSLEKATQGVDTVLLISTVDHHRFQQHRNLIDAAKKTGVKQISYTSALIKDINSSPVKDHLLSHFQTEDYLKGSGLHYTIFRNSLYADMIPIYVGTNVLESGIFLPAGDGKVAYALRREMGEGIANALLDHKNQSNTYTLTGGELYAYRDVAKALTELSGKSIDYTNADAATFPEILRKLGVPEPMIRVASGFTTDIRNHQYEIVSGDLQSLLGRQTADLKTALKELYKF